jgi:hypothetical protein
MSMVSNFYYYIKNFIKRFCVNLIVFVIGFMQTGIIPEFILFFDCPEDEMERRVLGRNQVDIYVCKFLLLALSFVRWYVDFCDICCFSEGLANCM